MRIALVLPVLAACRRETTPEHRRDAAPPIDEPAPVVTDDGILRIPATKTASGYELHLGRGRILLSMDTHTLVAPDPKTGAAALDVLAKWLDVPVPPKTHTQPLAPLPFEAIAFDETDKKIFFQRGAEYAEMYINVRDAEHIVEFVPKDSDYAAPLADMFADALRDGPAPARTMKTDPNQNSDVAVASSCASPVGTRTPKNEIRSR